MLAGFTCQTFLSIYNEKLSLRKENDPNLLKLMLVPSVLTEYASMNGIFKRIMTWELF